MKLFVSYAHQDAERVGPILEGLREHSYEVWHDETLAPGESFSLTVVQQLEEADVVLVFLSEVATRSPWVNMEIERAFKNKRAADIIPVVVGEGYQRHRLFPFLADKATLDIRELAPEHAVERIIECLGRARPYESSVRAMTPGAPTDTLTAASLTQLGPYPGPSAAASADPSYDASSKRAGLPAWILGAGALALVIVGALLATIWRTSSVTPDDDGATPSSTEGTDSQGERAHPMPDDGAEPVVIKNQEIDGLRAEGKDYDAAVLTGSTLRECVFDGAVMRKANLRGSRIVASSFISANLQGADLTGATLEASDLENAVLAGADLSRATIEGTSFQGAIYDDTTVFPADFGDPQERGMTCNDCPKTERTTDANEDTGDPGSDGGFVGGASTGIDEDSGEGIDDPDPVSPVHPTPTTSKIPRCPAPTRLELLRIVPKALGKTEARTVDAVVRPDGRVSLGDRQLRAALGPVRVRGHEQRTCRVTLDLR